MQRRAVTTIALAAALLVAAPAAAGHHPLRAAPAPTAPPTVIADPPTDSAFDPVDVTPDLSKPVQLLSDSVVKTDGGSVLHLPPGRYYRENVWVVLDTEIRRLQAQETRLTAENASLRTAVGGWQPGWWTLLTVACSAGAAGWWLHGKL